MPLAWVKSFISNRRFKVSLNAILSESSDPLDISVLQGSILGAILFLVYFNDFPRSTDAKSIIYADDSNCLFKNESLEQLKSLTENELKKISTWFRANRLQVSASKSQYMLFIPRHGKYIQDFTLNFDLNDPVHFTCYFPLEHIHTQVGHIHYNIRNTNDMNILRVKFEYFKKIPFILFPEA